MFWLGQNTLKIPLELNLTNRKRLCEKLRELKNLPKKSIVLLKGGDENFRYSTDTEDLFRQESYFHWAFGVLEPGYWGVIEIDDCKTTLLHPKLPDSYYIWMGRIPTNEDIKKKYAVDNVCYSTELKELLNEIKPALVLTLHGRNSDSGSLIKSPRFPGIEDFPVEESFLFPVITECRVFKSALEMEVVKYVAGITCEAHKEVMRQVRPGMMEYELESIFKHYVLSVGGCRVLAYNAICACGPNSSVLHYGHAGAPNDRQLIEGDLFLTDMGAEYYCYASDVTITVPVTRAAVVKFANERQTAIYQTVLRANRAVLEFAKPGLSWLELHFLAERLILEGLKGLNLVRGEIDDMMRYRVGAIFMPHGLGHLLGLDVHDVGGYPEGEKRSPEPGISALRTKRKLETGMVLTIEPGCYFIKPVIERALQDEQLAPFLIAANLEYFKDFGGVRIEDEVYITGDGAQLLTDTLPRSVDEIETFMTQSRIEGEEGGMAFNGHKKEHHVGI